jgi:hypothetical protein
MNSKYYSSVDAYLDDIVRISEEFNVDKFCISALGPAYENFENKDVRYAMRKIEKLVVGFAYIDLDNDDPLLIKTFYEEGFKGVKFICPRRNYDDDAYFGIYSEVARYGMVSLFHTGILAHSYQDRIKRTSSDRMRPIRIEAIARTFPEMTVVGAHFGAPWFEEASAVMRVNPNIYFDTSGGTLAKSPEIFGKLIESVAFEKFIFGTDSLPCDFAIPYKKVQKFFDDMVLSQEIQNKIMGGNIADVFNHILPTPGNNIDP